MIDIELQIRGAGLPVPEKEYRFYHKRKWRFDYAWPEHGMIALEVEGGTWSNGRHSRGRGYRADCEKYSWAAIFGWKVIRATTDMVADGTALNLIERAIRGG